jgi:hypothetical protein
MRAAARVLPRAALREADLDLDIERRRVLAIYIYNLQKNFINA